MKSYLIAIMHSILLVSVLFYIVVFYMFFLIKTLLNVDMLLIFIEIAIIYFLIKVKAYTLLNKYCRETVENFIDDFEYFFFSSKSKK